jgi:hypothetical protein
LTLNARANISSTTPDCKDGQRPDDYDHTEITFLGYQFRARLARNSQTGQFFVVFTPAVSPQAKQAVRYEIRSWELKRCATESLEEVAARINPVVQRIFIKDFFFVRPPASAGQNKSTFQGRKRKHSPDLIETVKSWISAASG